MEWQSMDTAPDGDYSVEIDIWDGYERIPFCFWNKDAWYYTVSHSYGYDTYKVINPKYWIKVENPV